MAVHPFATPTAQTTLQIHPFFISTYPALRGAEACLSYLRVYSIQFNIQFNSIYILPRKTVFVRPTGNSIQIRYPLWHLRQLSAQLHLHKCIWQHPPSSKIAQKLHIAQNYMLASMNLIDVDTNGYLWRWSFPIETCGGRAATWAMQRQTTRQ